MSSPKVGLFVPLETKPDQSEAVAAFLKVGRGLVDAEPLTLQWFAVKYEQETPVYAVFDTFAAEEGRTAHLQGKIAEALVANAPTLLASGPEIISVEVLTSKVEKGDTTVGLRVLFEAKPDKVEAVKEFLISALPLIQQETGTLQWYAVQFQTAAGPTPKFGIFDFSADEAGRQAHLSGQVAAALFSKVDEFFIDKPDVVKTTVLFSRV